MIKTAPFQYLLKVSRPRFYSYVFGPFLVGLAAGASTLSQLNSSIVYSLLLFFIVPANLFLYGINDLFDEDTDALNEKKGSKEHLLQQSERATLLWILIIITGLSLLLLWQLPFFAQVFFCLFMFLAASYSAPPLRFKARPFFDAYSNVLYAVPGFLAYSLVADSLPSWETIILGWTWTAGMHTLSAIPDIIPDHKAGITTTAVLLGKTNALWFVTANWLVFSFFTLKVLGLPVGFISLLYPVLGLWLLTHQQAVDKAYWWFPLINTLVGAVVFWYLFLPLL